MPNVESRGGSQEYDQSSKIRMNERILQAVDGLKGTLNCPHCDKIGSIREKETTGELVQAEFEMYYRRIEGTSVTVMLHKQLSHR